MNTHAIAAALAAVSLSAFAQPGALTSGSPSSAPSLTDVPQTAAQLPGALPSTSGVVLAKIDQNNTPPDRGGDPSGRQHAGTRM
ncbi:hypothetical protein DF107_26640 [Burkholderia stagnalis]|uniref:Uncharacterized protein n=1 Tax=Burkholderia stagnalis TaxID=1503054 RepID=A0A3P0D1A6_9BURK|nr:hypothetical protein [Burkholderia stagnalis]KAB0639578.1 hypothetical protein F7R25_08195 [Burkholderia stagnalis]KVC58121.1 hypothetical protein WS59_02925 [Burkholderia stagnalis]KVD83694.1 hypothetical protein WS63_28170 [Burkholderia stagnalis]KVL94509.1 hypothetical protein WT03_17630 [Burkholderia stagnalis]KVM01567.1 hypothetical protein WT02_07160 [Burkholderia stagnalis]